MMACLAKMIHGSEVDEAEENALRRPLRCRRFGAGGAFVHFYAICPDSSWHALATQHIQTSDLSHTARVD
jgi:hypothetical protein